VAILALEKDARLGFAARFCPIIDRQNNDRAGMPYDIAAGAYPSRLFHFIRRDAEHRPLETDAGREDASSLCFRSC